MDNPYIARARAVLPAARQRPEVLRHEPAVVQTLVRRLLAATADAPPEVPAPAPVSDPEAFGRWFEVWAARQARARELPAGATRSRVEVAPVRRGPPAPAPAPRPLPKGKPAGNLARQLDLKPALVAEYAPREPPTRCLKALADRFNSARHR